MRRWVCPRCGTGANAPERMASDDVRRYCLTCSASCGRLVARHAPAVERRRAQAKARAGQRRVARRRRAREVEDSRWTITFTDGSQIDVRQEVRRCLRLPELRTDAGLMRPMPTLTLHRRSDGRHSGRCYASGRVHLSLSPTGSLIAAQEVILHELVHYALPADVAHGSRFGSALLRAARQRWPDVDLSIPNTGPTHALDRAIAARVKAHHSTNTDADPPTVDD